MKSKYHDMQTRPIRHINTPQLNQAIWKNEGPLIDLDHLYIFARHRTSVQRPSRGTTECKVKLKLTELSGEGLWLKRAIRKRSMDDGEFFTHVEF